MRFSTRMISGWTVASLLSLAATLPTLGKTVLTPNTAIQTVRIGGFQAFYGAPLTYAPVSPDGKRFVLRLIKGDPAKNVDHVQLLTATLDSLDTASNLTIAASLDTSGNGCVRDDGNSCPFADLKPDSSLQWLDNETVAFLWTDKRDKRQIATVNLRTHQFKFLTESRETVLNFSVANNGTIVYAAQAPVQDIAAQLRHDGYTIAHNTTGFDILSGYIQPATSGAGVVLDRLRNQWFVRYPSGRTKLISIEGRAIDPTFSGFRGLEISPDGRFAITTIMRPTIPQDWSRYTKDITTRLLLNKDNGIEALQYAVLDLTTGTSRRVGEAPSMVVESTVRWSPDNRHLVIAPACLPTNSADAVGLACRAVAIFDSVTGQYDELPFSLDDGSARGLAVSKLRWVSKDAIEMTTHAQNGTDPIEHAVVFNRTDHGWMAAPSSPIALKKDGVAIEVRQDLNTPPRVFAVDRSTGHDRMILDPNPGLLAEFKLGHVEKLSGVLPEGNKWTAALTYPADYVPGKRYPLVIQSIHGHEPDYTQFELYSAFDRAGTGLGPTRVAVGCRQLLAGRNIAVIDAWVEDGHASKEGHIRTELYETVAKLLIDKGLVDQSRVALNGYSRAGFHVEYALTHSAFPFAAAIANDNVNYDYLQMALEDWAPSWNQQYEAIPFGNGLQTWLKESPGFLADKINAPLLMLEQTGTGVEVAIAEWETFSRLRALGRPVEMYIMPDIDIHPSHEPQNPRQLIAVQERVVDWFDFWLNNKEDPSPAKSAQYNAWQELRRQRDAVSAAVPGG